ncbi:hypothetical protein [Curvivirga aplysinae]|uniref:hypothetical protein n=1 Tax=Curvivirga aplysinae TaxID=2529852 RepID=UPI0012BCB528|nr:hypothetical protein [Curvivirga aplysinae]MTI10986.1 hypothetical protein [Curvivirga aplysinae]
MTQSLRYTLVIFVLAAIFTSLNAKAQELIFPNPDLSPRQVVSIQLKALADVGNEGSSGFLQTWIFAHPRNKAVTGPIERFALMLQSPDYVVLLAANKHKIVDVYQKDNSAFLFVDILNQRDELVAVFRWELAQARLEDNSLVWMTTNVRRLLKPDDLT